MFENAALAVPPPGHVEIASFKTINCRLWRSANDQSGRRESSGRRPQRGDESIPEDCICRPIHKNKHSPISTYGAGQRRASNGAVLYQSEYRCISQQVAYHHGRVTGWLRSAGRPDKPGPAATLHRSTRTIARSNRSRRTMGANHESAIASIGKGVPSTTQSRACVQIRLLSLDHSSPYLMRG